MDDIEVAPLRRDHGRGQHQLRPFAAEFGVLAKADGSARFSFGNSTVLAAVYGPVECPTRKEQADRATVEVYFKQTSSLQTTQDTEYGLVIKKSMESVILTALHPRTAIQITVQVINDDGSILAAAVNAVSLALLDAGISMKSVVAATSLVVSKDQILNDPTTSEENVIVSHEQLISHINQSDVQPINTLFLANTLLHI